MEDVIEISDDDLEIVHPEPSIVLELLGVYSSFHDGLRAKKYELPFLRRSLAIRQDQYLDMANAAIHGLHRKQRKARKKQLKDSSLSDAAIGEDDSDIDSYIVGNAHPTSWRKLEKSAKRKADEFDDDNVWNSEDMSALRNKAFAALNRKEHTRYVVQVQPPNGASTVSDNVELTVEAELPYKDDTQRTEVTVTNAIVQRDAETQQVLIGPAQPLELPIFSKRRVNLRQFKIKATVVIDNQTFTCVVNPSEPKTPLLAASNGSSASTQEDEANGGSSARTSSTRTTSSRTASSRTNSESSSTFSKFFSAQLSLRTPSSVVPATNKAPTIIYRFRDGALPRINGKDLGKVFKGFVCLFSGEKFSTLEELLEFHNFYHPGLSFTAKVLRPGSAATYEIYVSSGDVVPRGDKSFVYIAPSTAVQLDEEMSDLGLALADD